MREACKHNGSAVPGTKMVHAQGGVRAGRLNSAWVARDGFLGQGTRERAAGERGTVRHGRRMCWADGIADHC